MRSTWTRELLAGGAVAVWALTVALAWRRWRLASIGLASLGVAGVLFLLLPGRAVTVEDLRTRYVRELRKYEGAPYIWGGESPRGIDCSGLVRCGLIDAQLRAGCEHLNPGLVRAGISLWWNDCSAKALGEGRGTRLISTTASLNALDHAALLPGDIAVTTNGMHTMAYLGDRQWIEADPGESRVIIASVPSTNPWFSHPMRILRWNALEEAPQR